MSVRNSSEQYYRRYIECGMRLTLAKYIVFIERAGVLCMLDNL